MNNAELRDKIHPNIVDFGVVEDGVTIPYSIQNNSGIDFKSHTLSCGCLGSVKTTAQMVEGSFPTEFKEPGQDLYYVDGHYCQKLPQGGETKFYDVVRKVWMDNPTAVQEPVKAYLYNHTITLKMNDGREDFTTDESGMETNNPDKLKISVPVRAWILKK